ncbi:MAG: small ribosomal subunit Rsm22 family protein [Phycisphaerales bacterium]
MTNDRDSSDSARRRAILVALERWLWSGEVVPRCDVETVASAVAELSDLYTIERGLIARRQGEREHLVAKLLYFLASDAPKVGLVLEECALRDAAFRAPRTIVDLGCGVGATSAGFLCWLAGRERPAATIEIVGVDRSPSVLDNWRTVVAKAAALAGVDVRLETRCAELAQAEFRTAPDLLLCQSALNESLGQPRGGETSHSEATIAMLGRWATTAPLVVIEPGLRVTSRGLHAARDRLLARGDVRVVAPCPHGSPCPMLARADDWCHESRRVEPTPMVAAVQALTRRRDERAIFSFIAFAPSRSREPTAASSCRVVSDPLGSRGKTERWVCSGDGTLRCLRVLDRERTEANETLVDCERGTLVQIDPMPANGRVGGEVRVVRAASDISQSRDHTV